MAAAHAGTAFSAVASPPATLALPAHWQAVEFASDIHLSADKPRTAARFFERLEHSTADALILLGDLFDVWIGDDVLDAPGFEHDCVQRLHAIARHRALYFLPGNRDFLVGSRFLAASGCQMLADPTCLLAWQQSVLVTHGDAWCLDDADYQRFRAQVRDPAWQRAVLARPLADRRALAQQIRTASEQRKMAHGLADYGDVDEAHARQWLAAAQAPVLIHGHTHRPSSGPFAGEHVRHVLSDWENDWGDREDNRQGDEGTPPRGDVLRWTAAGIERLSAFTAGDGRA